MPNTEEDTFRSLKQAPFMYVYWDLMNDPALDQMNVAMGIFSEDEREYLRENISKYGWEYETFRPALDKHVSDRLSDIAKRFKARMDKIKE